MKRKRGGRDSGESSDEGDEEDAQSESLELTGSEESGSGEEGDAEQSRSEEEEESEEEDMNDSECNKCSRDDGDLLCCETCPHVYHLHCLDPPLKKVPSGDWHCPQCRTLTQLQSLERILSSKQASTSGAGNSSDAPAKGRQHLVKWKGKSYIHCTWVGEEEIQRATKLPLISSSTRSKLRKVLADAEVEARMEEQARKDGLEETDPSAPSIDPSWTRIGRVVAERLAPDPAAQPNAPSKGGKAAKRGKTQLKEGGGAEGEGEGEPQYLIKWAGLPYEDASWEVAGDLAGADFERELAKMRARVPICQGVQGQNARLAAPSGRHEGGKRYKETPAYLGGKLHPYQLEGLNWLVHAKQQGQHVILADEMGLGKTIQTIAYQAAVLQEGSLPHVVVVPLSTLPNWEREFATWAPHLNVVVLHGNQAARDLIKKHELFAPGVKNTDLQGRAKFHVVLTSYETVLVEAGMLKQLQWGSLVVDEGHRLKNKNSRLFLVLKDLRSEHRVLLSGTPLQNNIAELFMLLHFLDRGKFGNLEEFEDQFKDLSHEKQVSTLHEQLKPHLLRRMKRDVLKQLPPKREQIVRVELSTLQKEYYRAILTRNFKDLADKQQSYTRINNIFMELRKCCNHPYLLKGVEADNPALRGATAAAVVDAMVEASGKLALIDKMLGRLKERGHRTLIYSQFTTVLDILEDWLEQRGWGFQRIDGEVKSQERQVRIDLFNREPEKWCCCLLSTRAGGLGINLATADTVIIFDSDWNPHNDLQAQARAHRLGQLKPVMVYRLVTRATIEERMMQQAKGKMVLEHLVVQKMGKPQQMKQQELDDLLRYGAQELFAEKAADTPSVAAAKEELKAAEESVKKEGGEAEASAAAAEQLRLKRRRVLEVEQEAGRMGGDTGRRIVYDEAAIEKLLDRSQLSNPSAEDDDGEPPENDFMNAFKVAEFGAEEEAEPEQAAQPPAAEKPKEFWEQLLMPGYEQLQEDQLQALGKGKRARKAVNYRLDDTLKTPNGKNGSPPNSDSDSEFEEAETDSSDEDEVFRERRPDPRRSHGANAPASQPPATPSTGPHSPSPNAVHPAAASNGRGVPHPGQAVNAARGGAAASLSSWPTAPLGARPLHLPQTLPPHVYPQGTAPILRKQDGTVISLAPHSKPLHPTLMLGPGQMRTAPQQPPARSLPPFVPPRTVGRPQLPVGASPPGAGGGRIQPGVGLLRTGEGAQRPVSVPQPRSVPVSQPAVPGRSNQEFLLRGFNAEERSLYLQGVMAFGKGEGTKDALVVNAQNMARLLPHKPPHEMEAYAKLFDYYITHAEPGNAILPGNIPAQCVFFDKRPAEILARLGVLSLMKARVADFANRPGESFLASLAFDAPHTKIWGSSHDFRLLKGIIKHGYGAWQRIGTDAHLNLMATLQEEAGHPAYLQRWSSHAATKAGQAAQLISKITQFLDTRAKAIAEALMDSVRLSPSDGASDGEVKASRPGSPHGQPRATRQTQASSPPQQPPAAQQPQAEQRKPSIPGNMASVFGGIEWRPKLASPKQQPASSGLGGIVAKGNASAPPARHSGTPQYRPLVQGAVGKPSAVPLRPAAEAASLPKPARSGVVTSGAVPPPNPHSVTTMQGGRKASAKPTSTKGKKK